MALATAATEFVEDLAGTLLQARVRKLHLISGLEIAATPALASQRIAIAFADGADARAFSVLTLAELLGQVLEQRFHPLLQVVERFTLGTQRFAGGADRKSTRLNSSHVA